MTPSEKPDKLRRANQSASSKAPASFNPKSNRPTPTEKHDAATRDLIARLEKENDRHVATIERLQDVVNQLTPENARLAAYLANAEANSFLATIFIALGGGAISYATFFVHVAHRVADLGAGLLVAGVVIMVGTRVIRWSRSSKGS